MNARPRTREQARGELVAKIASQRDLLADPKGFSTCDPNIIIDDAEWRLRWIDCAPEGATHQVAILMDKRSIPCGGVKDENLGPCRNVRDARIRKGMHPLGRRAAA